MFGFRNKKAILLEEQNRLLKEELEMVKKELRSYARIVSHDIKAPLRGVNFLADVLLEDYLDKLDVTGMEHLFKMKNQVRRMSKMIDGILSYSRAGLYQEESVVIDTSTLR